MSSKKKSKSVERTKPDKSSKRIEPDIIQVKQPLSRGNQNANSNKNTQVVQIVFPPDTEIRKVKKKKKGKSSAVKKREKEREELLNQLKQRLEEYDRLQEQAQKLQIKIPEEIGIKVINQGDLKTNEDIQNYITDVVNKVAKLQELIQQSQQPSSAGLPIRLGGGIMQLPTLPPRMDSNIQPTRPPQPRPPQPNPQQPDKTKEELDKIAKDIQDRIDSGGGDGYAPFQPSPSQPSVPGSEIPLKEGDLIMNKGIQVGDKRVDVEAPKGWEPIYRRFRMYLENVAFITSRNELLDGVYHIPLDKENDLFQDRDKVKADYLVWFNGLERNLNAYILNPQNQIVNMVHTQMGEDLNMRPQDLAKKLLTQEGVKFSEITGGNELPNIANRIMQGGESPYKNADDNKEYKKYMDKYYNIETKLQKVRQEIQSIEATKKPIDDLKARELNEKINRLQTDLEGLFNTIKPSVKIVATVYEDKMNVRFNDMRNELGRLQSPSSPPLQPPVIDPIINSEEGARNRIKQYFNTNVGRFNDSMRQALSQLFGEEFAIEVQNEPVANKKREMIANKFFPYMDKAEPDWEARHEADKPRNRVPSGADAFSNPQRRMNTNTFMF